MKKICQSTAFLCLLALLFMKTGCASSAPPYASFAASAFDQEATWSIGNVCYAGRVSIKEGQTLHEREKTICYTLPTALAGMTVKETNGVTTVSLHGKTYTISEQEAASFLTIFRFFAEGIGMHASPLQENNEKKLTFSDNEGQYTILLSDQGCPREFLFESPSTTIRLIPGGLS